MAKLTAPSLALTFVANDVPNQSQTISTAYIVVGSCSFSYQLMKGLRPSSNSVTLSVLGSCPSIEDMLATSGDIKAVLSDNGTTLFTGYVSGGSTWSVTTAGEKALDISLEDVGTRLLGKTFVDTGYVFFNTTLANAITRICTAAGITASSNNVYPNYTVTNTIDSSATCKSLLEAILYEAGYVYYFDASGELCIFEINCSSISGIPVIDSTKLYNGSGSVVSLSSNVRKYKQARVTYTEIKSVNDYLVYRNTTGQDTSHPYCNMALGAGEYFDGTEIYSSADWATLQADTLRVPALVEACNASSESEVVGSKKIIAVTNVAVQFAAQSADVSATIQAPGGKYLQIEAHNAGALSYNITRLDAYATAFYEASSNVYRNDIGTITSDASASVLEETMEWLHTSTAATKHTNLLATYHKYCENVYTFYSQNDLTLGAVVELKEDTFSGLDVAVMITQKKYGDNSDLITYKAVGISVFNLTQDCIKETIYNGIADNVNKDVITEALYVEASTTLVQSNRRSTDTTNVTFTATKVGLSGETVTWYCDGVQDGTGDTYTLPIAENTSLQHTVEATCAGYSQQVIIYRFLTEEPEYQGIYAAAPATTPDGYNLLDGDYYYNSTDYKVYKYETISVSPYYQWTEITTADDDWAAYALSVVGDVNFVINADLNNLNIVNLYVRNMACNNAVINKLNATSALFKDITVSGSSKFLGEIISEPITSIVGDVQASTITPATYSEYAYKRSELETFLKTHANYNDYWPYRIYYTTLIYNGVTYTGSGASNSYYRVTINNNNEILLYLGNSSNFIKLTSTYLQTSSITIINSKGSFVFDSTSSTGTSCTPLPRFNGCSNNSGTYDEVSSFTSLDWSAYNINGDSNSFAVTDSSKINSITISSGQLLVLYDNTSYILDNSYYIASLNLDVSVSSSVTGIRVMDIIPKTDSTYNLGTSSKQFNNIWAIDVHEGSRRSLKENIKDYQDDALALINTVDVVSFNYKADKEKNFRVGFIADDTDEVLAGKNHDSMNLGNCIGVLLKAVQELAQKNAVLEAKIEALTNYLE